MSKTPGARFGGPRRRTSPPDLEALAQLAGRITAMEPQKTDPRRRSVFIDGVFAVGLHEETVILAGLKVGRQVNGPVLVQAIQKDEAKRAWDDALIYLGAAPRTRRDIEKKLARRYQPDLVQQVVERLAGGGWLDDAEFARIYVRSHSDYGERRLLGELARRGVDRGVAAAVVQEAMGSVDAVQQARDAVASRAGRMADVDRDTAQRRLGSFLARRGYDFDTISRALAPLLADLPRAPRAPRTSMGWRRRRPNEEE